jgi:hypothetical protein
MCRAKFGAQKAYRLAWRIARKYAENDGLGA